MNLTSAFAELVSGYPYPVVRTVAYLYMNYLHPHHKRIQAQGRHLLMLKIYESKEEAHCWYIPLKELIEMHKRSSEVNTGGVSLNDVQLVQTYVVENTFVIHAETFERNIASVKGSPYGKCTWVGGMALHVVADEKDANNPGYERSQDFGKVPDGEMAGLVEKSAKVRERRLRRKASLKQRKCREAAEQAELEEAQRRTEASSAAAIRKEALLKPHAALGEMFKSGHVREQENLPDTADTDSDSGRSSGS
eukprot:TRINITY_DN29769_c0_g1_i2.p1 TRINITY_DN29769_c0_g1~~TRINITY_DN29769_c0_g1_i2.p1  ORF type:complete len:250 (+),score=53.15 TRINITY_DN29769_c0_g1_i2:85-834(+)